MININKNIVYIAGLPRSGSTLLCQLLAEHPGIYSSGHSSPLVNTLKSMRKQLSDDPFLLSQMDVEFDLSYKRLSNAFKGFINGWFEETNLTTVVDKNRGWLGSLDVLSQLDPSFKMLVCVRDLSQIYASIEDRHQKTALIDFPDDMANLTAYERAERLFSLTGVVGRPLRLIGQLQDVSRDVQKGLYYIIFEDLIQNPVRVMNEVFEWLGVKTYELNKDNLTVRPHESDSYYRFKYPHKTHNSINPPKTRLLPDRINSDIENEFAWFYKLFYPRKNY